MKFLYKQIIFLFIFLSGYTISNACVCVHDFKSIDSVSQLKGYDFVAHVKILDDKVLKIASEPDFRSIGLLKIKILEKFKGAEITELQEFDIGSSCDMGISKGQEWVLFARIIDGKLSVTACDRNVKYKDTDGNRDWHFDRGFKEIRELQKVYQHPVKKYKDGIHRQYYPNGKPEVEETYAGGMKNGERKIWYNNGVLFSSQFFVNDSLEGKSCWYYPSGQLYDEKYFLNGIHRNISRIYFDSSINQSSKQRLIRDFYETEDSLNFVYKRIQVHYELIYSSTGRELSSREYTRLGKIKHEFIIEHDPDFITSIYYHDNGLVSSIAHLYKYNTVGRVEEFDKTGKLIKFWEYDEKGKLIRQMIGK